ncbi:MAG: toll/interleukin-1 receptor domain-containing protein [Hyphomicrobiaceae bacterium]
MAVDAFISYSHADEVALGRLHKHLSMLQRDNLLNAWTDHAILAGARFDEAIAETLESSSLFLALVSPDYLSSRYCYDVEFKRALALEKQGKLRIVPIILQPCDWKNSPLSSFLALPKDGKPVSEWTNENNAYLDVVTNLRRIIDELSGSAPAKRPASAPTAGARRLRVKRDFDAIQKAEFADQSFEEMKAYFAASCEELNGIDNANLKAKFEAMDANAFTCTIVNRAMRSGGEAHITVRNNKRQRHFGDISYVHERYAAGNTANGFVRVEEDEYSLFLSMDSFFGRDREKRYTGKEAAESLWLDLTQRAGIEYE